MGDRYEHDAPRRLALFKHLIKCYYMLNDECVAPCEPLQPELKVDLEIILDISQERDIQFESNGLLYAFYHVIMSPDVLNPLCALVVSNVYKYLNGIKTKFLQFKQKKEKLKQPLDDETPPISFYELPKWEFTTPFPQPFITVGNERLHTDSSKITKQTEHPIKFIDSLLANNDAPQSAMNALLGLNSPILIHAMKPAVQQFINNRALFARIQTTFDENQQQQIEQVTNPQILRRMSLQSFIENQQGSLLPDFKFIPSRSLLSAEEVPKPQRTLQFDSVLKLTHDYADKYLIPRRYYADFIQSFSKTALENFNNIPRINSSLSERPNDIDIAFRKVPPSPVDMCVYRCYKNGFNKQQIMDQANNEEFLSTSILRKYAIDWCEQSKYGLYTKDHPPHPDVMFGKTLIKGATWATTPYVICIIVPKGSKVIPLMMFEKLPDRMDQFEILLNRFGKLFPIHHRVHDMDVFVYADMDKIASYAEAISLIPPAAAATLEIPSLAPITPAPAPTWRNQIKSWWTTGGKSRKYKKTKKYKSRKRPLRRAKSQPIYALVNRFNSMPRTNKMYTLK